MQRSLSSALRFSRNSRFSIGSFYFPCFSIVFLYTGIYSGFGLPQRNRGWGSDGTSWPSHFFVHQRVIMTLQKIVISRLLSRDRVTSTDPFSAVPINQPRVVRYETKREQPSPRNTKFTGKFEGSVLGCIEKALRVVEELKRR